MTGLYLPPVYYVLLLHCCLSPMHNAALILGLGRRRRAWIAVGTRSTHSRHRLCSGPPETPSGGDQYIHNPQENSQRQEVLHECFRASSAAAFGKSGIVAQAAAAHSSNRDFRVLEIGCGAGATTLDLARQLPDTARVVGVDTNAAMIQAAKERLHRSENQDVQARLEFRVLSGEDADRELGTGSFDAVWMRFVLVHVPNPMKLVEAAARCLQLGTGILLIEDVNADGYFSDPPFAAHALINSRHIEASLRLGADVRRGPLIGAFMRQAGNGIFLDEIQCDSFVPMYGKGVEIKPWVGDDSQEVKDRRLDTGAQYDLGMKLAEMSLESLAPKFLELGVCTEDELEKAKVSFDTVKKREYQVFSFPGGQIFQWWARRSNSVSSC